MVAACLALAAGLPAQDPETAPDPEVEAEGAGDDWKVHGALTWRLLQRHARSEVVADERDTDLYQYLSLRGGSAGRHAVTAHFYGRSVVDIEGGQPGPSLSSLEDARGDNWDFRLYRAYLAFHRVVADGELRIGRQSLFDTPVLLHLDGASLDAPLAVGGQQLQVQAYAGVPEHFWEQGRSGDLALGTALSSSFWSGGNVRLDLMHLEDRYLFGDQVNSLVGGRVEHVFPERAAWVAGYFSFLDGDTRDAGLDGFWSAPETQWQVNYRLYSLLSRQSVNTLEFDPFTAVLLDQQPFYEAQVSVSKRFDTSPLGERWRADAGAYGRVLRGSAPAGEFNHEFQRYWLAATFEQFPWRATALTVNGDWWDGDDVIWSLGGELDADLGPATDLQLGSAFSLYRYDFFTQEERTRVRDHYLRLRHALSETLRLQLGLSFEEDEVERYQTATAQLELRF